MSKPVRVTVTGAAGQIGYSLVFRIASGQLLGPDQPVDLRLLEIPPAMGALEGVAMEFVDCAFPLLSGSTCTTTPTTRSTVSTSRCSSARVRARRAWSAPSCSSENGKIFTVQGRALNEHAAAGVKVLVVGNPANTNCLIAMSSAPDIPRERFTSMMRLDHNRAVAQLAAKVPAPGERRHRTWACGATTRRRCTPTCFMLEVRGEQAAAVVDDQAWIENDFLPNVGKRGAAIIEARGASSAASAANAAIDHVRDWVSGTDGGWVSMGVPSDGSYGIPEGLICGFPVHMRGRRVHDRAGSRPRRVLTRPYRRLCDELRGERDTVKDQGLI